MKITFRPLSKANFPLLLKWLEAPHVKLWQDSNIQWTKQLIEERYNNYTKGYAIINGDKKEIHAFIIYADGIAIGYIQVYNIHDFPQNLSLEDIPSSTASFDILIGEKEYLYKNIGSKALKLFFENFYTKQYQYVLASTKYQNIAVFNSYKEAGFTILQQSSAQRPLIALKNITADQIIKNFWNSYKQSYLNKDVGAIIDFFIFPCFLRAGDKSLFYNKDDFKVVIRDLLEAWSLKGFAKADFEILEIAYYSERIIQTHILWSIKDQDDNVFVSFESIYLLTTYNKSDLKIFSLVNLTA